MNGSILYFLTTITGDLLLLSFGDKLSDAFLSAYLEFFLSIFVSEVPNKALSSSFFCSESVIYGFSIEADLFFESFFDLTTFVGVTTFFF